MCTSIAMRGNSLLFGRNMDIDYSFDECVIITPRSFPLSFKSSAALEKHYAFIGAGAVSDNFPLYAEGMNENGLCAAALKFAGYAYYSDKKAEGKINLAPYEIIPYILGRCRNLSEAKTILSEINIIDTPFSEGMPLSPLHFHIADNSGSLVLESTREKINVYDNPANILTNNPLLPFHLLNIAQYKRLTNTFPNIEPKPFGLGFGAIGLPGDFSPASRFIKADFLLSHTSRRDIPTLFHILEAVSIPSGAVLTPENKEHITTYSCCMDANDKTYYFKTYDNSRLNAVKLSSEVSAKEGLIVYNLKKENDILFLN